MAGVRRGVFTCVGWQVTLCDPIWCPVALRWGSYEELYRPLPLRFYLLYIQELSYPPSILDLMVICWSRDPNDRPSANEIVSYASRPEFCSLLSSVAIGDDLEAVCACFVSMATSDVITPRSSTEGKCYNAKCNRCLSVCLSVCLSACLCNVCLSAQ